MLENLQWRWCCINKEPKLRGPADIFQLFDVQIFVCSEEGGVGRGDVVGSAMGYFSATNMLWVMGIWESASCQAFVCPPGQLGNAEKAKNAEKFGSETKNSS